MSETSHDQEILESVVRSIVEHPQEVRSERVIDEKGVLLTLYVNPSDIRYVLGREAKTVSSLRVILKAIGARTKARVGLKVFESKEDYDNFVKKHPRAETAAELPAEPPKEMPRPVVKTPVTRLPKSSRNGKKDALLKDAVQSHEERVRVIEQRLDVEFKDKRLLIEALTHRSYLNENTSHTTGHNERLEFIGDAALEIVVTEFLFKRFPDAEEGVLTNYRAALVNAKTLSGIAESFGAFDLMLMSKGERRDGNPGAKARMYICANVFESILGALYLDQGLGECRMFVDSFVLVNLSSIIADSKDSKSLFQEEAQERFRITPHYKVLKESGLDHAKQFVTGLFLGKLLIAEGAGTSKPESQVAAAKAALDTKTQWEGRIAELAAAGSALRRSRKANG